MRSRPPTSSATTCTVPPARRTRCGTWPRHRCRMISCRAAVSDSACAGLAEAGCAALPVPARASAAPRPAVLARGSCSLSSRPPAAAKNASAKGVGGTGVRAGPDEPCHSSCIWRGEL